MGYVNEQGVRKARRSKPVLSWLVPNMSLKIHLEHARNRFWVIPTMIVLALMGLSLASVYIPDPKAQSDQWYSFLIQGYSAEGARLILSSVATSLMTVIGVLFSLTVVILQQVSNQYSPRVIENFVRSYSSQVMLGVFVGTFVFCILLLRQVRESIDGSDAVIPQVGVSMAILLSLLSTAFLIHYIDHITQAIRSTNIIASIRGDAKAYFDDYKEFLEENATDLGFTKHNYAYTVRNDCAGYLENIVPERISDKLEKCGRSFVKSLAAPGNFLQKGTVLAEVYSERPLSDEQINSIRNSFKIGISRTHAQDYVYGIRQLTDVALRALSPGINDPTTAMESLNSIGVVVLHINNNWPLPSKISVGGKQTVIELTHQSLTEVIETGFSQIVELGRSHMPVLLRASEILELLEKDSNSQEGRKTAALLLKSIQNSVKKCENAFLYSDIRGQIATT